MNTLDIGSLLGIIALILAIPLGVAANLLTPRLLESLEKRKLLTEGRNREQELRTYRHIKAFREGKKDKYAYYMILASSSVLCGLIASTLFVVGLPNANEWQQLAFAFSLVFAIFAIALLAIISSTARRIEQFDKYKRELEERWGPVDAWLQKLDGL
jgi:H+/gluconate symporter-like permease